MYWIKQPFKIQPNSVAPSFAEGQASQTRAKSILMPGWPLKIKQIKKPSPSQGEGFFACRFIFVPHLQRLRRFSRMRQHIPTKQSCAPATHVLHKPLHNTKTCVRFVSDKRSRCCSWKCYNLLKYKNKKIRLIRIFPWKDGFIFKIWGWKTGDFRTLYTWSFFL